MVHRWVGSGWRSRSEVTNHVRRFSQYGGGGGMGGGVMGGK